MNRFEFICPACRASILAPVSLAGESSPCPKCGADVENWPTPRHVATKRIPAVWYYLSNGQERGPVTESQIRTMIEAGMIRRTDLVWLQGMPEWIEAREVPELFPPIPAAREHMPSALQAQSQIDEDNEPDPRPRRTRRRKQAGLPLVGRLAIAAGAGIVIVSVLVVIATYDSWSDRGGLGKQLEFAKGGEIYYTSSVTEWDAQKLGNYLVKEGYFDGPRKSVQLTSDGELFQVRLVTVARVGNDEEFLGNYEILADELSRNVFNGRPVEIHICNEYLKTMRVVQQSAKR
jgi:hypothetical protein